MAAARKAAKARAAAGQDPPPGAGNAGGRGKRGKKQPRAVRNITDPDSRAMHCTRNGAVQACNCQLPRAADGWSWPPAPPRTPTTPPRSSPPWPPSAAGQVIAAGHQAGGHPPAWSLIGTVTYDNGYFSKDNCAAPGPDRLIATGSWQSPASSGPHTPACSHDDPRDQMAHNLSTRQGRDIYAAARRWPRAASAS